MPRRTKIVATIGPASSSPETLGAMIDAGLDVARIGMAHGNPAQHLQSMANIRQAAQERGRTVGVLVDMPGPKIRTTPMGDGVQFIDGSTVLLRSGDDPTTAELICTDYPTCAADLQAGDSVTLGDGGVDLRVVSISGETVTTEVTNGGFLKGRPGLHLPADRVSLPVPTDEDRMLIKEVVIAGKADFVAVSFVRSAAEINVVRELISGQETRVVAKIETPAAIENLEEIVMASDAVMVARGDLGTECPFEDVPVYQKRIIRACLAHSKPVITATQMLESMITASTPTRAEASDVANAVCDGSDAIMLSAESAIGADPVRAVATMARIAERAEIVADYEPIAHSLRPQRRLNEVTAAVTHGARQAAIDAGAVAILCCTRSGATARAMASLRPETRLIALSTSDATVHQETLTWGVTSVHLPESTDINHMVEAAIETSLQAGLIRSGDLVAVVSGSHDTTGSTDSFRILQA